MRRRSLVLTLGAVTLCAGQVAAQPSVAAPKYAVLSLIGEKFNVVTFKPSTGSSLDRNTRESIMLQGNMLDAAALGAVRNGVRKIQPKSEVFLYTTSDERLFGNPTTLFEGNKIVLPAQLIAGMKKDGATHLLLASRFRQEARIELKGGLAGTGFLEGVGYYIDRHMPMMQHDGSESNRGFLSPYVYLQLSLVDLSGADVQKKTTISASQARISLPSSKGLDPWDVLSAKEKLDTIIGLIDLELETATTDMLK
jgi:ribosomal protein S12